jgi:flagellar biosynthesis protein FlhB
VAVSFASGSCVGALAFAALVAYAHLERRELDRVSTSLSEYFSHPTRAVMMAAYACLSISLICAAAKMQTAIVHGVAEASGVLISIAAALLIPIALTTRSGQVDRRSDRVKALHRVLAMVAFGGTIVAMAVYSVLGLPSEHRYQRAIRLWAVLVSLFAAMTFVLLVRLPSGARYYGLVQKVLSGLVVVWLWIDACA